MQLSGGAVPGGLRPSRSGVLVAIAVALGVAFVVAPATLAGGGYGSGFAGSPELDGAVRDAFVGYWHSGAQMMPPDMSAVVDYWQRYHVVKAVLAALLLAVVSVLAVRFWSASTAAGVARDRRRFAGAAGTAMMFGGLGAAVLVMANVQGAIAPLSSVLSILPAGAGDSELADTRIQVVQQLRAGDHGPVLSRMVSDFALYHAVLATAAVVVAVAVIVVGVKVVRSRASTECADRVIRRRELAIAAGFAVVAVCLVGLAVVNAGTASHPSDALLLFFTGN